MVSENNQMGAFSDGLAQAVTRGGQSTVLVNGRRRFPASGIAYSKELILTADHVVERDDDLSVILADGTSLSATVAGRNPGSDVALLRLENSAATPAERTVKEHRVGQMVLALGRSSADGIEASLGIISAVGGPARTGRGGLLESYLRTDAIPFPGFSGGPLIDTEGRVVGLNTSGLTHGSAITIPVGLAWADAENLAKFGYVKRGFLGIRSQTVAISADMCQVLGRDQETGLLLVSVETDSPAEVGGLLVGDIMVAIDGHPVEDHDALFVYLTGEAIGKAVDIQVLRGGQPISQPVKVGERK